MKALYDDGPSLADVMRQKLDEQKARNNAEFADVDPVTRLQYQGYGFLLYTCSVQFSPNCLRVELHLELTQGSLLKVFRVNFLCIYVLCFKLASLKFFL